MLEFIEKKKDKGRLTIAEAISVGSSVNSETVESPSSAGSPPGVGSTPAIAPTPALSSVSISPENTTVEQDRR